MAEPTERESYKTLPEAIFNSLLPNDTQYIHLFTSTEEKYKCAEQLLNNI